MLNEFQLTQWLGEYICGLIIGQNIRQTNLPIQYSFFDKTVANFNVFGPSMEDWIFN